MFQHYADTAWLLINLPSLPQNVPELPGLPSLAILATRPRAHCMHLHKVTSDLSRTPWREVPGKFWPRAVYTAPVICSRTTCLYALRRVNCRLVKAPHVPVKCYLDCHRRLRCPRTQRNDKVDICAHSLNLPSVENATFIAIKWYLYTNLAIFRVIVIWKFFIPREMIENWGHRKYFIFYDVTYCLTIIIITLKFYNIMISSFSFDVTFGHQI